MSRLAAALALTLAPLCALAGRPAKTPPIEPPAAMCDGTVSYEETVPAPGQAILTAACQGMMECTDSCVKDDLRFRLVSQFQGQFACAGKRESVVSLAPCKGGAGELVLLQATAGKSWKRANSTRGFLRSDACKVERAGNRDIVLCRSTWSQASGGTFTTSVCAAFTLRGEIQYDCPLRLSSPSDKKPVVEVGDVSVVPGNDPRKVEVSVAIGRRAILLDLDETGFHLSPKAKQLFDEHPIPGMTIQVD